MEFRHLLKAIRKEIGLFLTVILIGLVIGGTWLLLQPQKFSSAISVVANYENVSTGAASNYFQYNNYYGTMVANSFSDSIPGLLKNTGVVKAIFDRANVDFTKIQTPATFFTAVSKGKYVNEIRLSTQNQAQTEALSNTLITTLRQKADEFSQTSMEGKLQLGIDGPTINVEYPAYAIDAAVIVVFLLGLALLLVAMATYLKNETFEQREIESALSIKILSHVSNLHHLGDTPSLALLALHEQLVTRLKDHTVTITFVGPDTEAINALRAQYEHFFPMLGDKKNTFSCTTLVLRHAVLSDIQTLGKTSVVVIALPDSGVRRDLLQSLSTLMSTLTAPRLLVTYS